MVPPVAVKTTLPPAQKLNALPAEMLAVGFALTVTAMALLAAEVQPPETV